MASARGILMATALFVLRMGGLIPAHATEPGDPVVGETPSADRILDNMRQVYAECESYADEGEVSLVFKSEQRERVDRRPFKTWFIRPENFRFEFRNQHPSNGRGPSHRYVVWADGEHIRSYWTVNKQLQEFESVELALGGPTGVSGGSATMIPALLMREMNWGGLLRRLSDTKLLGTERVGDALCYKVEGRYLADRDPLTLWIDADSFFVRRVFETSKVPNADVEKTIEYRPHFDIEIPKDVFDVDPDSIVVEHPAD